MLFQSSPYKENAQWLASEAKILAYIALNTRDLAATVGFALESAFPEHPFRHGILLATNVPRAMLGLDPNLEPGDIDYLLIPKQDDELLLDRIVAVEAKVVRPSLAKPARNTNSRGSSQVKGLLRDGFPFIGLVHICLPEPLPKKLRWNIPMMANRCGPKGELEETGEYMNYDPFPSICVDRQEGRLVAMNLPREVAFKAVGFTRSKDQQEFVGNSFSRSHCGLPNPAINEKLTENIARLTKVQPGVFTKIEWFS